MKAIVGVTGRGGSGKSTFCLRQKFMVLHGKILRKKYGADYFANNPKPYAPAEMEEEARAIVRTGILDAPDNSIVYIDGMPRDAGQVAWLQDYCKKEGHQLSFILVQCDDEKRVTRLSARSTAAEMEMVAMRELKECTGLFAALTDIVASGLQVSVIDNTQDQHDVQ